MEPLISVIVPIYNVAAYVDRCVASLQAQSYRNLEIFLVDDGSTDGSEALCDEYAAKDPRVRVLHKKNGGLSDARNAALEQMQGAYVAFVDGDDWVSPYYIENLYRALKQADADLAVSCFEEVFEGQGVQTPPVGQLQQYTCLSQEEALQKMLYQDGMECSAWGKLYPKRFFQELRYPVGKLYEDIPVTYAVMRQVQQVAYIRNVDYYYFQRQNSIQNAAFNPRKMDGVEHCRAMMEAVMAEFPQLGSAAECRYLSTVCNILFQIRDAAHEPQRNALWQEVRRHRWNVVRDPKARKKARLAALLSYGGYGTLRFVYDKTQWRASMGKKGNSDGQIG